MYVKKVESVIFFFSSRRRHTKYWRDWSSDVCSSDLGADHRGPVGGRRDSDVQGRVEPVQQVQEPEPAARAAPLDVLLRRGVELHAGQLVEGDHAQLHQALLAHPVAEEGGRRSEEHTSELQSRQYLVCRLL